MSLAATLSTGGMRPASFLPTIKCSNCGDDIEISAMGDHECQPTTESPNFGPTTGDVLAERPLEPKHEYKSSFRAEQPSEPKADSATTSNAFSLRAANAKGFQPAQPSPLRIDSPPPPVPMPAPSQAPVPQMRQRAPTLGSNQAGPRMPRPALPRINADMANKPFLIPLPHAEMPISPAASSQSGSSLSNKPPPPLRSMTSPMPRIFDPRPPSPELSANLDCAFPPFPKAASSSRRPSTSSGRSGRKTPNGSERAPSRSTSRQRHRLADISDPEPKSPSGNAPTKNLSTSPLEPSVVRSGTDETHQPQSMPLDRRRPSSPGNLADDPPPLPPLSKIESFQQQPVLTPEPSPLDAIDEPILPSTSFSDKKLPPARPARPTNSLTPSLLDNLSAGPASSLSAFPVPPLPLSPARSNTFPLGPSNEDSSDTFPSLTKVRSEPALRDNEQRPPLPASRSEPSQVPQSFPARGASRNEARMDYRLQDAPPVPKTVQLPEPAVPKPVQLHRADSFHRPSESESSNSSSLDSLRMTNSSGPSPVASAASSVDAFSPFAQEMSRSNDDNSLRVAGLNVKNNVKPGMRAEQPKEKSPPPSFARPAPLQDISRSTEEPPVIPAFSWPLESPMDPAMKNAKIGDAQQDSARSSAYDDSLDNTAMSLNFNLTQAAFISDDYDPYRALTPQKEVFPPLQQKPDSSGSYFKTFVPRTSSRSQTPPNPPLPAPPPQPRQGRPRSKTESGRPIQQRSPFPPPPPIPQSPPHNPPQMQLSRRPTIGGRTTCRGCGLVIEGKSIKAADGGLTGRWHKACFVCKTCDRPFPNADFYVLNNQPYCEQHYHEKNRSLCFGCRKGIEGPYLETKTQDQRGLVMRKYHPKCLACATCRKILTDDYYDFKGGVYCETHAMASMRAVPKRGGGPGGSMSSRKGASLSPLGKGGKAEKVSTKLMTMGK